MSANRPYIKRSTPLALPLHESSSSLFLSDFISRATITVSRSKIIRERERERKGRRERRGTRENKRLKIKTNSLSLVRAIFQLVVRHLQLWADRKKRMVERRRGEIVEIDARYPMVVYYNYFIRLAISRSRRRRRPRRRRRRRRESIK